jgi:adenylosuccinate lyase
VNDEENKNEILHVDNEIETEHAVSKKLIEAIEDLQVKIENLTRKVDSLKELLPHETFCQKCVDPDKAQTKSKNLIANHLNLQSQVNNNITNKPAAINAKQQSSNNGSDSQRKQNVSSFF